MIKSNKIFLYGSVGLNIFFVSIMIGKITMPLNPLLIIENNAVELANSFPQEKQIIILDTKNVLIEHLKMKLTKDIEFKDRFVTIIKQDNIDINSLNLLFIQSEENDMQNKKIIFNHVIGAIQKLSKEDRIKIIEFIEEKAPQKPKF